MKRFAAVACGIFAVMVVGTAQAATNTPVYYSFNTPASLFTADTGSSLSAGSFVHFNGGVVQSFAGTTLNAQPGFIAGNVAGINKMFSDGSDDGYFQFTLNALGMQDISISYASARSSSAANGPVDRWVLQYSTDGGSTFIAFATNSMSGVVNNIFKAFTNDLSAVTALNNNAQDVFRIVVGGASVNTGGTGRLDNFTMYANDLTVVPEPSTMLLLGVGLLGLVAFVRRR